MILTENQIKNLIKECVNNILSEAHQATVKQIQTAIDIVEDQWQSPDDVWWIKIEQRLKDHMHYNKRHRNNPGSADYKRWDRVNGMDGTSRENHVGYVLVRGATKEACVNSIKNAVVHLNPWAAKKMGTKTIYSNGNCEAIILACNVFFARAYMTINRHSMSASINAARNDKKSPRNPFKGREFHHRIGQSKHGIDGSGVDWDSLRPWGLIDCDVDDVAAQQKLEAYLAQKGIKPFRTYLSHDGKHYILKDKDADKLDFSFMNQYNSQNRPNDPNTLYKRDANMMLYSNTGQ